MPLLPQGSHLSLWVHLLGLSAQHQVTVLTTGWFCNYFVYFLSRGQSQPSPHSPEGLLLILEDRTQVSSLFEDCEFPPPPHPTLQKVSGFLP